MGMCDVDTQFYAAWCWVLSAEAWTDESNRLPGALGGDPVEKGNVEAIMSTMIKQLSATMTAGGVTRTAYKKRNNAIR
eukprot:7003274-Heterocapsa_arctica.AAC.1